MYRGSVPTMDMDQPTFRSWFAEEFGLLDDELADGDPLLLADLDFDSWRLFVLHCWLLELGAIDEETTFTRDDIEAIRVSHVWTLYEGRVRT